MPDPVCVCGHPRSQHDDGGTCRAKEIVSSHGEELWRWADVCERFTPVVETQSTADIRDEAEIAARWEAGPGARPTTEDVLRLAQAAAEGRLPRRVMQPRDRCTNCHGPLGHQGDPYCYACEEHLCRTGDLPAVEEEPTPVQPRRARKSRGEWKARAKAAEAEIEAFRAIANSATTCAADSARENNRLAAENSRMTRELDIVRNFVAKADYWRAGAAEAARAPGATLHNEQFATGHAIAREVLTRRLGWSLETPGGTE